MIKVAEVFAQKRKVFEFYTPFGVLLEHDLRYLVRATARDTGSTEAEVRQECGL